MTIALLLLMQGCSSSFLDVEPKGKRIASTVRDYDLMFNNTDLLNVNTDAQVLLGDDVATIAPFWSGAALRNKRLFEWKDDVYEGNEDAIELTAPMQHIYAYNKIIDEVLLAKEGTDVKRNELRAEALLGRAWTYFLLINYYGAPYDKVTAGTDLGFPIVRNADATKTVFERATVAEVYNFIEEDLREAIKAIPQNIHHRMRGSLAAAQGLLGKVLVFKGDYANAWPLLDASVQNATNATIPVKLYDYNVEFQTGGVFTPVGMFGPAAPLTTQNHENLYAKQFVNYSAFISSDVVIIPEVMKLYAADDLRLKFYSNMPFPAGVPYKEGMMRRTGPSATQFGVILPELYLLRAEAAARINKLDLAKADLLTLRKNRMPETTAALPLNSLQSADDYLKFIEEERHREFAGFGYRWFDLRRYSVSNKAILNDVQHVLYEEDGSVQKYTLDPKRLLMRFPTKLMLQNPNMQNND